MDLYDELRRSLGRLLADRQWEGDTVHVAVRAMSPEECIGTPEHHDYPIITGRERMLCAQVRGAMGQAFTDTWGDFVGTLGQVVATEPADNFQRAVLLATLNAVMRAQGRIQNTVHCRDDGPVHCAAQLADHLTQRFGQPRIGLVGLQPRMIQALAPRFSLRVVDLDPANIGTTRYDTRIEGPEATADMLQWCEVALVTGTTLSNDTTRQMLGSKPTLFYGVTVAGAAEVLGLERFCPCGS